MATAAELLLPLRPGLVPVPARGQPGVCRICHSGCEPSFSQCYACHESVRAMGAEEILPISMSVDGDLLHRHLRGYKDDRSHQVQARMSLRLAALLAVFLQNHQRCVGEFDSVVPVPSPARTAIEAIIRRLPAVREQLRPALQATGRGSKSDLRPDRFRLTRQVDGERLVLLDDTFTRGPTIFSAAGALREAGATVVCQVSSDATSSPTGALHERFSPGCRDARGIIIAAADATASAPIPAGCCEATGCGYEENEPFSSVVAAEGHEISEGVGERTESSAGAGTTVSGCAHPNSRPNNRVSDRPTPCRSTYPYRQEALYSQGFLARRATGGHIVAPFGTHS